MTTKNNNDNNNRHTIEDEVFTEENAFETKSVEDNILMPTKQHHGKHHTNISPSKLLHHISSNGTTSNGNNNINKHALILVNCQNDFFENGSVPVPNASSILDKIKILRQRKFDAVIHCQEYRPGNDSSFYSNNPGSKPNEIHHFVGGRTQTIHEDYCVQGSYGAKFHSNIYIDPEDIIVRTGYNPEVDSYSAFRQSDTLIDADSNDDNVTELQYYLSSNNITHVYICGLGTDRTLQYTVLDAKEIMHKAHVFFIEDASIPYDESNMFNVYEKFQRSRVILTKVHSNEINKIPLRYNAHLSLNQHNSIKNSDSTHNLEKEITNTDSNDNATNRRTFTVLKHALPTNVLDSKAWDAYYDKLLDELEDEISLVELAYIRLRAKYLHPTHKFPPMPKIEILHDIGVHSYEQILLPQPPQRKNILETLCTTGDVEYLKLVLNESINIKIKQHEKQRIDRLYSVNNGNNNSNDDDDDDDEMVGEKNDGDVSFRSNKILNLNRAYRVHNTARTLLILAIDTNYPGQRTHILNLLLDYTTKLDVSGGNPTKSSNNKDGKQQTYLNINAQDRPSGKTALMHACCVGDLSVVEILLEHGADVNIKSSYGRTALMFACEANTPANIEMCRKILAKGHTVMTRYRMLADRDQEGWNCLHFASKCGILLHLPWDSLLGGKVYAQLRLQFHKKTVEGLSVLHLSAWNNRTAVVKFMVSNDHGSGSSSRSNSMRGGGAKYVAEKSKSNTTDNSSIIGEYDNSNNNNRDTDDEETSNSSSGDDTIRDTQRFLSVENDTSKVRSGTLDDFEENRRWSTMEEDKKKTNGSRRRSRGKAYVTVPLAPVLKRLLPNQIIPKTKMTELDVAVSSEYFDTALCLASQRYRSPGKPLAFYCNVNGGKPLQNVLYRGILAGNVKAVQGLFRFRQNQLDVDPLVLAMTRKMKYKDTCTFTWAAYNSPTRQPCWFCGHCKIKVCIVCKDKCHSSVRCKKQLKYLGTDESMYCECNSRVGHRLCQALSRVDVTELKSYEYVPKPIDVSDGHLLQLGQPLDNEILHLSEMISVNMHEEWSLEKIANGWTYRPIRNDKELHHNCLVPWYKLLPEDKQYDHETSIDTIKAIIVMGFNLEKMPDAEFNKIDHGSGSIFSMDDLDEDGDSEKHAKRVETVDALNKLMMQHWDKDLELFKAENRQIQDESGIEEIEQDEDISTFTYNPHPFDLSFINIPPELDELIDSLARNSHDTWATAKIDSGWTHGSKTDQNAHTSHLLVPYEFLPDDIKQSNITNVYGIIKTIIYLGWKFVQRDTTTDDTSKLPASSSSLTESSTNTTTPTALNTSTANATAAAQLASTLLSSNATADYSSLPNRRASPISGMNAGGGMSEKGYELMRRKEAQLLKIKQQLLNCYLLAAAQLNQPNVIDELLHARDGERAEINCVNSYGQTPLYISVKLGHIESAEKLLSLEARTNQCCHLGLSPLMIASALGNRRMVKLLFEMGADLYARDLRAGFTPLHYAAYKGRAKTCHYLTSHIAGLGKGKLNSMYVKPILNNVPNNGSPQINNSNGNIFVTRDDNNSNFRSSEDGLKNYISNNNRRSGRSKYAYVNSSSSIKDDASNLHHFDGSISGQVRTLNNKMGFLYNEHICGYAPLSVAVKSGKWKVVRILINNGADPMQKDGTNKRPYERALRKLDNIEDLIIVLEEHQHHNSGSDSNITDDTANNNVQDTQHSNESKSCASSTKMALQTMKRVCCTCKHLGRVKTKVGEDPELAKQSLHNGPNAGSNLRKHGGIVRTSTLRHLTKYRDSTRAMMEALNTYSVINNEDDEIEATEIYRMQSDTVSQSYDSKKREKKLLKKAKRLHQNLDTLIMELNKSETVSFHRSIYAMRTALINCIIFLIIELVIVFVLVPNVSNSQPYELSHFLKTSIESGYTKTITDRNSWYDWHTSTLYPGANEKSSTTTENNVVSSLISTNSTKHVKNPLHSIHDINTLLDENILVGKIAIQLYNENPQDCPVPHEGFVSQHKVCYPRRKIINFGTFNENEAELKKLDPYPPFKTSNSGDGSSSRMIGLQLSTRNMTEAILTLKGLQLNSKGSYGYPKVFISQGTTAIDTFINVYNPSLEIFAAIRARTIFGTTGYAYHDVQVYSFQLGYDTDGMFNFIHPPSVSFQISLWVICIVVIMKFFPSCFRSGMSVYEIVYNIYNRLLLKIYLLLCTLCIVVIWIDAQIVTSLNAAPLEKHELQNTENGNTNTLYYYKSSDENTFLDFWDIGKQLRNERDWLSVLILVNGLALIMNTQYIPVIGPLVFAIGATIFHVDVLIFLVLYALIMLIIAVTFVVSFGSEFQYYSTLSESFMSLFNVPFAEQFDNVLFSNIGENEAEGSGDLIRFFYSMMYLLIAMMTTNLFIAIVTQVFPQEREKSTRNWDGNITKDLQQIERQRRLQRKRKHKRDSPSGIRLTLRSTSNIRQQYRSVKKLENKPFSELLKDSFFMSQHSSRKGSLLNGMSLHVDNVLHHEDYDHKNSQCGLHVYMRNDRLFEGENGFEYWTRKGLYSNVSHATGSSVNTNYNSLMADDSDSDSSSSDDVGFMGNDGDEIYDTAGTFFSNLNDEQTAVPVDLYGNPLRKAAAAGEDDHRRRHHHHGAHYDKIREDGTKWTKMQHNMEDQAFRLNQLQNHINAVEITISGLMKMSRETLMINKELIHHHNITSHDKGSSRDSLLVNGSTKSSNHRRRRKGGMLDVDSLPNQQQ